MATVTESAKGKGKGSGTNGTNGSNGEALTELQKNVRLARTRGVPLLHVETPEPAAAQRQIVEITGERLPAVAWDAAQGLHGLNPKGREILEKLGSDLVDETEGSLFDALKLAAGFPQKTLFLVHNAHRHWEEKTTAQMIWNLRDLYKSSFRALVLLTPHGKIPPSEFANDLIGLREQLPDDGQLGAVVDRVHEQTGLPVPSGEGRQKIIAAVSGLTEFACEQVTAMSLTSSGAIDGDQLWARKFAEIERAPGLKVLRGGASFGTIGGLSNVKKYAKLLLGGRKKPRCIVFIDEIEKMIAGIRGDSTGVSQDQLGQTLTWMQKNQATGMIFVGHAGGGKSALAEAMGNEADIPTVELDYGGMKTSLHGESETHLRHALEVVRSISAAETMWVATCNSMEELPAPLRRRFKAGTFFFDLPTAEEREPIWEIHGRAMGVDISPELRPDDDGWTGAEIQQCIELTHRTDAPLREAAQFVVPSSTSDAAGIAKLRAKAHGSWLSASYPGVYRIPGEAMAAPARSISLED